MTADRKLQIGVIFGGRSGEYEVSLMSARSVLSALDPEKYAVTQIGITHEGAWLAGENILEAFLADTTDRLTPVTVLPDPTWRGLYAIREPVLSRRPPGRTPERCEPVEGAVEERQHGKIFELYADIDVFFPVLHGTFGEDGTLQGLFEMAGVAYVGAGVLGSSVGMDKGVFKDVMRANGFPIVDGLIALRSEIAEGLETLASRLESIAPYPLFVKPANMGSSVGVTKCRNRSDLYEGLMEAARFDRRVLIERGINAREIEISVLGNDIPQASIPGEIRPAADFYSYEAKYHDDRSEAFIPADIPPEIAERMRAMAVKAYRIIDCAGMARVDFLLDKDTGEFYLNEVNTIPGFTKISMYPKLWEASGLPYPMLVDRLIELAVERRAERDRTEWRYER